MKIFLIQYFFQSKNFFFLTRKIIFFPTLLLLGMKETEECEKGEIDEIKKNKCCLFSVVYGLIIVCLLLVSGVIFLALTKKKTYPFVAIIVGGVLILYCFVLMSIQRQRIKKNVQPLLKEDTKLIQDITSTYHFNDTVVLV